MRVFRRVKADSRKYSTFDVVIQSRLELNYGHIMHIRDRLSL